jgi:hypothetical protein
MTRQDPNPTQKKKKKKKKKSGNLLEISDWWSPKDPVAPEFTQTDPKKKPRGLISTHERFGLGSYECSLVSEQFEASSGLYRYTFLCSQSNAEPSRKPVHYEVSLTKTWF